MLFPNLENDILSDNLILLLCIKLNAEPWSASKSFNSGD